MPKFRTHRWTLTVLSDGSGVALSEWKSEHWYREHVPDTSIPTDWILNYDQLKGISDYPDTEIHRVLARRLLEAWKKSRHHQL